MIQDVTARRDQDERAALEAEALQDAYETEALLADMRQQRIEFVEQRRQIAARRLPRLRAQHTPSIQEVS